MPWKPSTYMRPKIDYLSCKRLWFVHAGTVYSVQSAPSIIFQDAVLAQSPYWINHETYGPILAQCVLDYHDRWWLLNCLADKGLELKVYATREAAERAALSREG